MIDVSGRMVQVAVRVPEATKRLLERLAEARGEQVSDIVRRAIRRELARAGLIPEDEARLLEIRL